MNDDFVSFSSVLLILSPHFFNPFVLLCSSYLFVRTAFHCIMWKLVHSREYQSFFVLFTCLFYFASTRQIQKGFLHFRLGMDESQMMISADFHLNACFLYYFFLLLFFFFHSKSLRNLTLLTLLYPSLSILPAKLYSKCK